MLPWTTVGIEVKALAPPTAAGPLQRLKPVGNGGPKCGRFPPFLSDLTSVALLL